MIQKQWYLCIFMKSQFSWTAIQLVKTERRHFDINMVYINNANNRNKQKNQVMGRA